MPQQIILRKGTAAAWTAAGSVVLAAGEPGFETDTGKFKIGNGTLAWTALSYAVGAIPVNLADLADVTSDTPSSGQVLKWNGSAWAPAADSTGGGTGATYTMSAATIAGGANLRLTGSDASTDDVKFASGTGITVSRTDADTITIASTVTDTNTTYGISAETTTGGAYVRLTASNSSIDDVKIAEGYGITVSRLTENTLQVSSNVSLQTIPGAEAYKGFRLTPTTGVAQEIILTQGPGISISRVNAQELQVSSTLVNMVGAGTENRLAMYTATGSQVNETNEGLTYTLSGRTLALAGGTHNLYNSNIFQIYDTYSALRTSGITTNNYFDGADTVAWNIVRSRGTYLAKTTVVSGDDIGSTRYYAHTASTAPTAPSAVLKVKVEGSPVGTNVPSQFLFRTNNGTTIADRAILSAAGVWKVDSISALNTNANLALSGNGTGIVTLPAGTTVGGVAIGSLVIKGTVANNTALLALTGMTLGDTYVVLSPTPTHLWSYNASSTWVDLGEFQGPAGQGVPVSGTIGQVLTKNSSTNYDTGWTSLAAVGLSGAYGDLSGTPTLATVATSGAYADLSGRPTLATVATSGAYSDLSGTPTAYASTSIDALSDVDTTTSAPTNGQTLVWNSAGSKWLPGTVGAGDMVGPASATDNALVRFDGTTGKLSQTSLVTVSDTGAITAPSVGSVIPFYFADQTAFPSATTYHGAIAHSHADGKMYFAHSTTWNALANASDVPAAYSATSINALSDVDTVTAAPTNGQALVWNSVRSNWEPGTVSGGGGVTYGISAETNAGGADIRLTGSDASTDNLTIAAGTNVTVTRTDANTITIASSGGGGSMAARGDVAGTTASLADAATGNVAITGFKSYALLKILVDQPAWVRIYTDTASRSADASRAEGVDPTPGSGVIAEVITTSAAQTVLISPGTIGFNNEGTPTTSIPIAVTNKSGTTRTITVTLTVLQLEA